MQTPVRLLFAPLTFLGPMVLAGAIVGGLLSLVSAPESWAWPYWLMAAPVLYAIWLIVYLVLSALMCGALGRAFPKPRYLRWGAGSKVSKELLGLATAGICYRQLGIISTLPLAAVIGMSDFLRKLWLHAYAPTIHFGQRVQYLGLIYDPDLTDVGDDVVIGAGTTVNAHAMTIRADGVAVFVSAPVKIGNRVTVGGSARIEMGVVIEDGAIVEPSAFVTPFTRIPADEVWGGNPATFRRQRQAPDGPEGTPLPTAAVAPTPTVARAASASPARSFDVAAARQLVIEALSLDPAEATNGLSSETCSSWDSLGKIAIATTIFDRYGVELQADAVLRLETLDDIARALGPQSAPVVAEEPNSAPAVVVDEGMPDDVELLPLMDSLEATRLLARRDGIDHGGPGVNVVIAASFVVDQLANPLKLWGRGFDLELTCKLAGYNQVAQVLLDANGPFATNSGGVNVLLIRPEDVLPGGLDPPVGDVDKLLDALAAFAEQHAGQSSILVGTLPPVVSSFALHDRALVDRMRHAWRARLESISGVEVFEFSDIVERLGVELARNSQAEVLMRAPYSSRLFQELGRGLVRHIRAMRRSPAKVIAVDCDNTLWGGVVGEVGAAGIVLGSDGPGRGYQLFQHVLKQLKQRGVLLAIVSRNEEHDVREVFEQCPEMVLRPDDIAAWRVNWNYKSQSLRELADELNVGLDAFVFVDDDPAMRLEVKSRLPAVHVVPLAQDPASFCDTLARLWLFDGATATSVDASRTQMMQEEQRRTQEQQAAASLEDYLSSLQLIVELSPPGPQDWPRVAQLTQRTNQFSLSLKRRTLEEVKALARHSSVLVLRARDRFGDYGLIGVCVLAPTAHLDCWQMDTLLMSCRALGRGVEDAFLHGISRVAAQHGAETLLAPFVQGKRNDQVKQFLATRGFQEGAPSIWELPLGSLPPLPEHVVFRLTEAADLVGSAV